MNYTKKTSCENTTGSPVWGNCRQDKYHSSELQLDHKDGNPFNNDPSNKWTICSNCHQRKTDYMGDRLTPGRGGSTMNVGKTQHNVNRLIEFYKPENFNKLRRSVRRKYFTNPFKKAYGNGKMNCLEGPCNLGKTFAIYVELGVHHFSKGGRIQIALSPMVDSQTFKDVNDYVHHEAEYDDNSQKPYLFHSENGFDWGNVQDKLDKGKNVIIVMSDQYFNPVSTSEKNHVEVLEKLVKKYNTLLTRDEASYGMLSSWEISKKVLGNVYSSKTNQSFFKNFKRLYEAGAHSFGITATPTKEMKDSFIGLNWNIANTVPNNEEMIPFRKWYRNLQIADWSHDNYDDESILPNELNGMFSKITAENIRLNEFDTTYKWIPAVDDYKKEKIVGMIVAQTAQGSREKILIQDILDFLPCEDSMMQSNQTLIVTKSGGWKEYNSEGEVIKSGLKSEYQTMLKDPNHPAHYLVVMNKAIYGVNINNLGFGLIFRQYQNEDDLGHSVTLSAEQLLGRFNRINASRKKIMYLLKNYGVHAVYEYLLFAGIGCFDIKAPKSKQFETAFENFKKNQGTHQMDALNYLFDY